MTDTPQNNTTPNERHVEILAEETGISADLINNPEVSCIISRNAALTAMQRVEREKDEEYADLKKLTDQLQAAFDRGILNTDSKNEILDVLVSQNKSLMNDLATLQQENERLRGEAIQEFIYEVCNEFPNDNWDYFAFIKDRIIDRHKSGLDKEGGKS